jgi:hypothetical protein
MGSHLCALISLIIYFQPIYSSSKPGYIDPDLHFLYPPLEAMMAFVVCRLLLLLLKEKQPICIRKEVGCCRGRLVTSLLSFLLLLAYALACRLLQRSIPDDFQTREFEEEKGWQLGNVDFNYAERRNCLSSHFFALLAQGAH